MKNRKVSDMNKEYIINFLQEYSYYIKEDWDNDLSKNERPMCPTEFFQNKYLDILFETEETELAFTKEPGEKDGL